jgi:hypothetical protein
MTSARSHLSLTIAVTCVLAVTAVGEMFFVLPRYRRFVEGIGVEPSLPARLAIAPSRAGLLLVAAIYVALAAGALWDLMRVIERVQ